MTSIIVYSLLLFLLIVLFFFGTKLNRQSLQTGKASGLVKWLTKLGQSTGIGAGLGSGDTRSTSGVDRNNPEVQKTLAVLSDLYGEFQETVDGMREDMALTLEASHSELQARVRQLEERVAFLEGLVTSAPDGRDTLKGATLMQSNVADSHQVVEAEEAKTNESQTVESQTTDESQADESQTVEAPAAYAERMEPVPHVAASEATRPELSALYTQILDGLRQGKSREELAKALGIGLTEVQIVERIFGMSIVSERK